MRVGWIGILAAWCALAGEHGRLPVVQAIEFKNFHGVAAKDIVERLHDRDIEMVSRAYSARCVETAPHREQHGRPGYSPVRRVLLDPVARSTSYAPTTLPGFTNQLPAFSGSYSPAVAQTGPAEWLVVLGFSFGRSPTVRRLSSR